MRAAIYARTAIKDDGKLEEQIASCRKYASEQNLEVISVCSDLGKSGTSPASREGIQRLMMEAAEGVFDTVLMVDTHRLSRNLDEIAETCHALQSQDIDIVTTTDGLIPPVFPQRKTH